MREGQDRGRSPLPFYYGWVIVGIAFVTMGIGVSARTSFSLLMPPLIDEFGWDRSLAAGAFSFGFLVSAVLGPTVGRLLDRRGPPGAVRTRVRPVAPGPLPAAARELPLPFFS